MEPAMKDGKYVILCVDDDPDVLEALKILLVGHGYSVEVASDVSEALERARDAKPDLSIVDLMMEEIDSGIALVAQLRSQGLTGPIYMLSAAGDELHQNVDASKLGLDGVIQKPVDAKILTTTIAARLKLRPGEGSTKCAPGEAK
jgi:DNA-binding response OmpR family regulator